MICLAQLTAIWFAYVVEHWIVYGKLSVQAPDWITIMVLKGLRILYFLTYCGDKYLTQHIDPARSRIWTT